MGGCTPWGGLPPCDLHFYKALIKLRLTVCKISAVKWPKFRPKISDLGMLEVYRPKGEKIWLGPICTIMQNFTPIGATVAEISVTRQRKNTATNIPFHTNTWQVKMHWKQEAYWGIWSEDSMDGQFSANSSQCCRLTGFVNPRPSASHVATVLHCSKQRLTTVNLPDIDITRQADQQKSAATPSYAQIRQRATTWHIV